MERITLFADILLPLPVKGTFTYRVPYDLNEFIKEGQRAAVQFGKKKIYTGLIKKLHQEVPEHTPKYILHLLDEKSLVNTVQFRFWEWLSSYYMSTEGEVMNAALPSAFKLASESRVLLSPSFVPDHDILDEYEYKITEALLDKKRLTIGEIGKTLGFQNVLPFLKKMIEKKMLVMEEELQDGFKPKMEKYVRLVPELDDEDALQQLMDELGKRAFKQLELLMTYITISGIFQGDSVEVSKTGLLQKANAGNAAFKSLVDKKVFEEYDKIVSRLDENENDEELPEVSLTNHQTEAYERIKKEFEKHNVVLLHGVTSGGKTELYINLIKETIQQGKEVLYLLPEIALTTQIITRLKKYFGNEVGIYHSRYSKNERAEVWNNVVGLDKEENNKYKIILGPRSSVFLPFSNLGLIIVDEEHDQSYKQFDPAPRYNARDASIYLATLHNAKVLLGSATPAIESYFNTTIGKYGLVEVSERYGGMKMPVIEVVDMRDEQRRRMLQSHFSSVLMKEVKSALKEKQQVILFQNRRGFSLRIECEQCNFIPMCKNCDVTLTYHKKSELLRCHYCGYSTTVPPACPDCGSTHLKMQGFGTEKVEEELSILLPDAKIDRLDLDSTRSKHAYHRIITDFENRKTDILTGTQMVTKGLDFDNVQVVGILSADNMLSFPDFRAHERSFQLMAQVSGRSGRKYKQGKVIIQTWQPEHPIILQVVGHDYLEMYKSQLRERKQFKYPPFYRMIIARLKHKRPELLNEAAKDFGIELRSKFGNRVIGPEYPLVSRIKNLYIKQIILKNLRTDNQATVKELIFNSLEHFRKLSKYNSVMIQFDVDPM
jgi:primosomal protein N' (replication factor Y) (superfamily II helicase)